MQSAILALGGYLVLQGQLSPGLIVAASILLGRALAPVENLSAHWAQLRAARAGWRRLNGFLDSTTAETGSALAQGQGDLTVRHLVVTAPGKGPVLQVEGFCVAPGQALGVIGPSGAGKSALAQAILGVAPVVAGQARLGIAALPGAMPVGYLPQTATLFAGTIAQNIARFAVDPDLSEVEHVSRMVGLHDHVMRLGRGYETCLASNPAAIPQGVVQRIALARAFYGAPRVVILDDPNAHLDADGVAALNRTIRAFKADGAIVVVMANRPSGISECDDLLVLDAGRQVAYGPRDKVLREVVRNHTTLIAPNVQAVQG
jgi:ATP-binding cassette subfamily C protein